MSGVFFVLSRPTPRVFGQRRLHRPPNPPILNLRELFRLRQSAHFPLRPTPQVPRNGSSVRPTRLPIRLILLNLTLQIFKLASLGLRRRRRALRKRSPLPQRSRKKRKPPFDDFLFQTQIDVFNVFRIQDTTLIFTSNSATFADAKTTFRRPYGTVFARRV